MPDTRNASLALVVLCAVVLPALAGLIAGALAAPEPKAPQGHLVGGRSLAVTAPLDWRQVKRAPVIPGLRLHDSIVLAPGDPAQAGLVAGQLKTEGHGPLPASFLRRVRNDLRTDVVGIGSWDGYRYSGLRVAGFAPRLAVYAVPTSEGSTAVACYATPQAAARMAACEQIARSLDILSGPETGPAELSRGYARSVSRVLGRLDGTRLAERRALRASATPGHAAGTTQRLALAYDQAARALTVTAPPDVAGGEHALLIKRLWRSRDAYRLLTSAARAESEARWNAARRAVENAEDRVSTSLGDLGALGYGRTA